MDCKCKQKFSICHQKSNIHFISLIPELTKKLKIFFEKLKLIYSSQDNIITIEKENPKIFFEENIDAIKTYFNTLELNEIKVYIENEKHKLSLNTILYAKPLEKYLNFIEDKTFFDILENKSLTSHFQPIIDIHNKKIFGYEALVRGVMPNGDLVYPDILFEKSARNDMDFKFDRLCRENALKTTAVKKVDAKVFINFIPTTIYDPKFCLASTVKWAKQLEFDPKNIVFEVVETQKVKDIQHLKTILNYYRQQGFLIALDDVGEGYSSLNMIIDLKPDIIKVDRNIITNIDQDEMKRSVYKALRNVAMENNIKILAEGVETPYELATLKNIGLDYAQGYYFAKPSAEIIRQLPNVF
ncbi:EAL domain-containing protein [Malaciobacter molluscorum LMG 25693]|uniref:Diguanylate phosphodiesterase n=1 Tax=Malaciobacter molluscorum LMG 25693 TaxID=870501 RepID=A0A2G1DGS9_9BACT|nr:EAL domain-containing protein [Malaciobacter molluscorum]AXX92307.1 diguanylate phosphodiesterase [Malaciobacter molluscorum LMG 25693]PHO17708.1 EAL domain-containing protein [Malaciobacter molluscorum LMG 25693]